MKKLAKIGLPILAAALLSFLGLFLVKDVEYRIDTDNFETTVAYSEDVNLSGLKIIKTVDGEETTINVNESMVTECDSTLSVGTKSLKINYEEQEFVVNFVVKYRVEFYNDTELLSSQYVLSANQIDVPSDPRKTGYEFDGWSPGVPSVINDNMTFNAIFRDFPKEIPNLGSYDAVYGDTLATITLPKNDYGTWEFIDSLETMVGNVGKNEFAVKFIPKNEELKVRESSISIYVSKMTLTFNITKKQFDYDGLDHIPEYYLTDTKGNVVNDSSIVVDYFGDTGRNVGQYIYSFSINSTNYEGNAMGYFSVVTNQVIITVDDQEISLGDNLPEFTYTVEGVEESTIPLLNIEIIIPDIKNAGTYEISAKVNNPNYTDVVVKKGILTVKKITLGATDLTIESNPVYGDTLSSVIIANDNQYGYWSWVDGSIVLDHAGDFEVEAVFTPTSSNYDLEYRTVVLPVAKRVLEITITNYEYVYDGEEKQIEYTVDGFVLNDTIEDIVIEGNTIATNAGNTSVTLTVVSSNYQCTKDATLSIKKATPETDFTTVFEDVVLDSKLNSIILPEGYTWDYANTILSELGEQVFAATYTPSDTENYEKVSGEFIVVVIKKTAEITADSYYEFEYTGNSHLLSGVYSSHNESELEFTYLLDGKEVPNIKNAGNYEVIITLPESDNYFESTLTVLVSVTQASVEDEPSGYDAIYGDTLGSITLPTSEYGVWSWKESSNTLVGNVGKNTHVAIFTSLDDNYKSYEVNVVIEVAKKKLTIVVDSEDNIVDYDGNPHSIIYSIEDDIEVNVKGNTPQVKAGTYSITLEIVDDNYEGILVTTLVINKIDAKADDLYLGGNGEILWNTNSNKISLPEGYEFKNNYVFDEVGEIVADLVYTPEDTDNYNSIDVKAYITVSMLETEITYVTSTYTYNGQDIMLNVSTSNTDGVTLQYTYKLNGQTKTSIKDAGEYTVVITSPESDHYKQAVKEITVNVNKASAKVEWSNNSYTYNVDGQTLPSAFFNDVNNLKVELDVTFVDDSNPSNTTFKNVSTYKFNAVISDELAKNYTFTNIQKVVEIQKATIDTSSVSWNSDGFPYTGEEQEVFLKGISWPSDVKVNYDGNRATDVGDYTATVSFVYDTNNYNTISVANPTHVWEISASKLTVVWENDNDRTYSDSEFELPTAYIYDANLEEKIYLEVSMDKVLFKDAGTYVFSATDTSGNYELLQSTTTVIVNPYELTVSWEYENSYVYTGSELAYPTATIATLNGNVELTPTIVSGGFEFVNASKYKFAVSYDNSNYSITNEVSKEVEILKATFDMSEVKWNYETPFIYDGIEKAVFVTGLPAGVTVASYEGDFTGTNADTYTAKVVLSYDSENYNEISIDDLVWTINPKEVSVVWENAENRDYTSNEFSKPTAYIVDVFDERLNLTVNMLTSGTFKNAGDYVFEAICSSGNYQLISSNKTVKVNKAITSLIYNQEFLDSLVYDEGVFTISELFQTNSDANISVEEIKYKVTADSEETSVDYVKNAGTYTIYMYVAETTNYLELRVNKTLTVKQGNITNIQVPTVSNATYGDTLGSIILSNMDTRGTWTWKTGDETSVGNAGTNSHILVFTPTNTNYKPTEYAVQISVGRKTLTIEVTGTNQGGTAIGNNITTTYSGTSQTIAYKIKDGSTELTNEQLSLYGITVSGNTGWKNASATTYSYTLTINSTNYQGTVSGNLTINKATPIISGVGVDGELIGDFYEDRLSADDIIGNGDSNVDGKFTVTTDLIYGANESDKDYDELLVEWVFEATEDGENVNNYNIVSNTVSIRIYPVAYVGSKYYGTVDKAISNTVEGTIVVIPGTNPIIKTNGLTIAPDVTLFLPHTAGDSLRDSAIAEYRHDGSVDSNNVPMYTHDNTSVNGGTYDGNEVATSNPDYLKSTLYIDKQILLTNKGSIEIAGELSSGAGNVKFAGQTYGYYSRIVLKDNAELVNNGTIKCFGYIEEETLNNRSQLTTNSGGRIYMPFIMRDFYGGSTMYAIYSSNEKISPFNQFEFRNITCISRVNYGGAVTAWANIYANDQHNYTDMQIIGIRNSVINLTNPQYSYITIKYSPESEIHDIDVFGGASTSSMIIRVNVGFTASISTDEVLFPISWRYNISLNKAAGQSGEAMYSMQQSFKLLPGSVFTVEAGSNLDIYELAIYEEFDDILTSAQFEKAVGAYPKKDPASFIVNGKVNANKLGGLVKTTSNSDAQLSVTSASVISREATRTSGSSLLAKLEERQTFDLKLKLHIYENGVTSSVAVEKSAGVYISNVGGWSLAENLNKYIINFVSNGGSEVDAMTIYSEDTYHTLYKDHLPKSSYPYYSFDGWYYKVIEGENEKYYSIDEYVMYAEIPEGKESGISEITLYAMWSEAQYKIEYDIKYQDCDSIEKINDNPTSYQISSPVTLKPATDGDLTFVGWFLDSDYTISVTEIYTNMGGYGLEDITLYGYFTQKAIYTITFVDNQDELLDLNTIDVPEGETTKLIDYNSNINYPLVQSSTFPVYFGGWYTTENYEVGTEFTEETPITSNLTLYAKWIDKKVISFINNIDTDVEYSNVYFVEQHEMSTPEATKSNWSSTNDYISNTTYVWEDEKGNKYEIGESYVFTESAVLTLSVKNVIKYYKLTISASNSTVIVNSSNSLVVDTLGEIHSSISSADYQTIYVKEGQSITGTVAPSAGVLEDYLGHYDIESISVNGSNIALTNSACESSQSIPSTKISGVSTITVKAKNHGGCFAEGTLITLADGSTKKIEDLTKDDYVLAWDFEKGTYVAVPVLLSVYHGTYETNIINLVFEDGTTLKMILEHGFFDATINEWVYIDENNYNLFVGHEFVSQDLLNSYSTLKLVDAYVTTETVGVYGPVAAYTINCYAQGILSIVPATGITKETLNGLFHYFEIGENLQYDLEKMEDDINLYGLYTYEEFKDYVTEYEFEALNMKYLKVSVGKGYISKEEIILALKIYFPK